MGEIQGFAEAMPPSWTPEMDRGPNFLQWVTQPVRSMIDAAARGTLMSKTEEEAYNLIEEMALNNYQWSNERGQPKRVGSKYEIDALTLLTAKMDAMTQKLDKLNVHAVN